MDAKRKNMFMYIMLVYFILIRIPSNMHASLIPALTKSIAADGANLKMYNSYLTMALSLGSMVMNPVWGKLIDKYGVKIMIILTSVGFALAQTAVALSAGIALVCMARFMSGAFMSGVGISAMTYLVYFTTPENREKILAVNMAAGAILGTVSILIGGYISEYGIKTTFFIQALGMVAIMAVMNLIIPAPPVERRADGTKKAAAGEMSFGQLIKTYKGKVVSVCLICALAMVCSTLIGTTFNTILAYDYNYTAKSISQLGFIMGLFASAVMLIYNFKLKGKLSSPVTLIIGAGGMFAAMCVFVPMAYSGLFLTGIAVLAVYRCFSMLIMPAYQGLMSSIDSANRGKLMSLITLMESLGMLIGNFVSPKLSAINKFAPYLYFLPVIALLFITSLWTKKLFLQPKQKQNT